MRPPKAVPFVGREATASSSTGWNSTTPPAPATDAANRRRSSSSTSGAWRTWIVGRAPPEARTHESTVVAHQGRYALSVITATCTERRRRPYDAVGDRSQPAIMGAEAYAKGF